MSKLFIIDGNSYIHRAYHALPPLTNSRGEPVGALFGFTRMLVKIIRKEKPDYMLVCFDSPQPTFRHEEYKEYKATRKETDEDLRRQLPLSRDVVEGMGLNYVAEPGLEADDLIAGAVEKFGREKDLDIFIVSGDKDIYQLVGDKVFVYNEPKNRVFDAAGVREIFGIPAGNITDYLALAGDSSDNIPGVRGIGPRTAVQLLSEFPSLDKIYSNLESVPPKIREKLEAGRDNAFLSRKLAVLARPEIKMSRDDLALGEWQTEKLVKMLERFEFTSILKEIDLPVCKAVSGEVITSGDRLKEIIKEITNMQIFNAILIQKDNNDLGIVFGGENNYFLPFGEMQESLFGERDRDMIRLFKDLIENGNVRKDSGDLKKLLRFFRARGIEMKGLHADTGILSYLVNPERDHSLGRLAAEYLQSRLEEPEDVSGTPAFAYASLDILRRVTEPLFRELENAGLGRLYRDVELPLVRIIAEMEDRGVLVDLDFFGEFSKKVSAELSGIEDKIRALCGKECNLNSPKQLAEVLFHKLNLPVIKRGKTGPSTSEEVLIELSALHPLPGLILQYREVEKIRSTYVDPVWDLVGEDGRLHPTFHQNVTATGRLSSSNPNLQNIPIRSALGREIRRGFMPAGGFSFVSFDYSQIDLRVLAHYSGDPALVGAFREDRDIHTATAEELFEKKEISKDERRIAKTVNFGISYGMGAYGLSRDLRITKEAAKNYIDSYFRKYPGVKTYMENIVREAREKGYVTTLLGRRRYVRGLTEKRGETYSAGERIAINTPIQGTSSDIIKVAMVRIAEELGKKKFPAHLLIQIHDELLFEVEKGREEEFITLVKPLMEGALKLSVPVRVDSRRGNNWFELE